MSPGSAAFTQLPNAQDELQIRDKLALYAYAVDDKKFDLFDQIFTADVKAVYSDAEADQFDNVDALKSYLANAVAGQVTQHAISSILVQTSSGAKQTNSTSYFVATFFGQGDLAGEILA
ncbi:MAG: hypothetical protein Q9207_006418 [Kuettlingeria erythrocarpa]